MGLVTQKSDREKLGTSRKVDEIEAIGLINFLLIS